MTPAECIKFVAKNNPDALWMAPKPHVEAITGIASRTHNPDGAAPSYLPVLVYDLEKLTDAICRDMQKHNPEATWEEAAEYVDFNVVGAWLGDGTPIYADPPHAAELW